jgi:hypothetical protein
LSSAFLCGAGGSGSESNPCLRDLGDVITFAVTEFVVYFMPDRIRVYMPHNAEQLNVFVGGIAFFSPFPLVHQGFV